MTRIKGRTAEFGQAGGVNDPMILRGVLLGAHLIAATIWTGGHIVLATCVLPRVLRERSAEELQRFEGAYERVGMPALLVQVVTGLLLAHSFLPDVRMWFDLSNPVARGICVKLALLAMTLGLAVDARLRVIPKLSERNLTDMAWHIVPVTILSVLFVLTGLSFRTGWLAW